MHRRRVDIVTEMERAEETYGAIQRDERVRSRSGARVGYSSAHDLSVDCERACFLVAVCSSSCAVGMSVIVGELVSTKAITSLGVAPPNLHWTPRSRKAIG